MEGELLLGEDSFDSSEMREGRRSWREVVWKGAMTFVWGAYAGLAT